MSPWRDSSFLAALAEDIRKRQDRPRRGPIKGSHGVTWQPVRLAWWDRLRRYFLGSKG